MQIRQQLQAELDAAQNKVARERAAIAVLERPFNELSQKQARGEITADDYRAESEKWRRAENCIDAENALKDSQPYYTEQLKKIEAGCQRGPVSKWVLDTIKEKEKRKAEACGRADLQIVAGIVKRLSEIMAERAANEEKETAPVKQADISFKDAPFCKQVRSLGAHAANQYKSIIGPKTEKYFAPGVKISEMVGMDSFETSVSLEFDLLAVWPKCRIEVGNEHDNFPIGLRVGLQYVCDWDYELISRKQLEERADKLFNAIRGCFAEISESSANVFRHDFVADKSIQIQGKVNFGEKNPSNISLFLSRYAPEEDLACTRYSYGKKPADREMCMRKFKH